MHWPRGSTIIEWPQVTYGAVGSRAALMAAS